MPGKDSRFMNKKEIAEIKKQFTPANCAITKICGCYVSHEKEKLTVTKDAFLSLPEEEEFKYFDILKHTLGGTVGKHLVTMEFPLDQEAEGGTQEFLLKLRNSRLEEEELTGRFFDKVIESYEYGENYYIILIHAAYDVPGKALDGTEMFDASEEVYEYLLCSICPVKMSKPGLSYNAETNRIEERIRDWVVEPPANGFLFPAFEDRGSDIHKVLYFAKNPELSQDGMVEHLLGSEIPLSPATQKETFQDVLSAAIGENGDYETMRTLHENITEIAEENKENPDPVRLDKKDVSRLLSDSGIEQEDVEFFEEVYDDRFGEKTELLLNNIADTKKFQIETPEIVIKVAPDRADLVETMEINGRQCLVIPVDGQVEVNGISVRTMKKLQKPEQ